MFIYDFFVLFRKTLDDFTAFKAEVLEIGISRLDKFPIDSESKKFSELILNIFGECECKNDSMPDHSFRKFIGRILLEMKECG